MPPSADHNLLFGVLALQADLLDPARFAEACTTWAARKDTPLAQILIERGWLTAEEHSHVAFLLERKLRKHQGDLRASLAEAAGPSARKVLDTIDDISIRESLANLPTDELGLPSTQAYQPERRERYTLSRLHAKGGIGQVWLAHDAELGRDVALKELRPERADHVAARARFLEEAQITGQLEHPSIVPVYELARRRGDQQPFYTMRFVQGRTLREAIRHYHTRRHNPQSGPLELTGLLSAFVAVCQAVAYAHSRGVLHRDLKPDNVVLGDYGEVLLLDWGLARLMDRPAAAGETVPVSLERDGSRDATVQGQVLGTPAYMAPEQAAGRLDQLDWRSDVYGLGAILYELLTGRPPFDASDTPALLQAVRTQEPVPPRQRVGTIPAALEAVCLKALARKQADRYAKATELAEEVRRHLADEPVSAYPEPVVRRLGRWSRRHRPLVAAAAALLVTAVAALAVGFVLVDQERAQTERANGDLAAANTALAVVNARLLEEQGRTAQANAALARTNTRLAAQKARTRQALDDMTSEIMDDLLARQTVLTPEHKKFLEKTLADYEEFAHDTANDEASRAGVAAAYFKVGNIRQRLGKKGLSEAAYRESIRRYVQLAADFPAQAVYALQLGLGHNNLGWLLYHNGHAKDAAAAYRQAIAIQTRLATGRSSTRMARGDLALTHNNLGVLLNETGHPNEAIAEQRRALELRKRLVTEVPNEPKYRNQLAQSHYNLAAMSYLTGHAADLGGDFLKAIELQEHLVAEFPAVPDYTRDLANSYNGLGTMLLNSRRTADATRRFRQAVPLRRRLVTSYPAVPAHRFDLAETQNNLGAALARAGHRAEAEVEYRQALNIETRLVSDFSGVPEYRALLGESHGNLALLLQQARHPKQAAAEYRLAVETLERLAVDYPSVPDYRHSAALALTSLGFLTQTQKDPAGARHFFERALPHYQAALKANPNNPHYRMTYAAYREVAASNLATLGSHKEAAAAAQHLAAVPIRPVEDLYAAACLLSRCVPAAAKDLKLAPPQRHQLADDYAKQAIAMLQRAVAAGYNDVAHMKKDTDLDPLRQRADFKRLLEGMSKQKLPGKGGEHQVPTQSGGKK